jgi:hypothetical protein
LALRAADSHAKQIPIETLGSVLGSQQGHGNAYEDLKRSSCALFSLASDS